MGDNYGNWTSEDENMGSLLKNLLNPPQETPPAPAVPPVASQPATPAPPPPAKPTTPAAVSTTGNTSATPTGQKSWADYVRQSNDASMSSLQNASQAANQLQNEPSATSQNAPLEQQRVALAQPLDPSKYKPGIGTRIVRGIVGAQKGGLAGVVDPTSAGETAYGAPTRQFGIDQARRTAQAGVIQSQEDRNIANAKADSERLKDIGTEQRAVATGYGSVAKDATAQQNAEQKADYNQQLEDVKKQLADQGGVPKTYEQTVIASHDPSLPPAKQQQYKDAADQMAKQEIKKFSYAAKASADPFDSRRQSMVDSATSQVQELNDKWYYNAAAGRFYDSTKNPDIDPNDATVTADQIKGAVTPSEFTDMKNKISTKLDADLTRAKLRPLGVRFDVKKTTPGGAQPAAQPGPTAPAAPAQTAPKSAAEAQPGQVYKGFKYVGGDKTQKSTWQQVSQ